MESHWVFNTVSFHIVLSWCSVETLPVSVTFSSARWDCACLSSCFLTLPDRVCPQRDSCARDRSGHGLSCFQRGQKAGSQILILSCWCSAFSVWSSSCLHLGVVLEWEKFCGRNTCNSSWFYKASFNWNDWLMKRLKFLKGLIKYWSFYSFTPERFLHINYSVIPDEPPIFHFLNL